MSQPLSWLWPRLIQYVCIAFVILEAAQLILGMPAKCPAGDICNLAGQKVQIEGKIVSISSVRLERIIIEISAQKPQKGIIQATLPHTQYDLFYGDRVVLSGKLKLPKEDPKDNFSYPLYLAGKGIFSVIYYPEIEKIEEPEKRLSANEIFYQRIFVFREKARLAVNKLLAEPAAAVINAMLIGDQGMVPDDLRQGFSKSGVIHILSVSGAHVTLVILMLVFLVGFITISRSIIFLTVASGVIFYLMLSGAPDCAVRAGIMGLLAFWALQKGKLANIKILFWLSGAILICLNPLALIADVGFQLSYLAVFGMIYLFPLLLKTFCWGREGLFWKILKIILLSFSITLTVSPPVLYYFRILSSISPLANLVLLPFFSILLPLGFVVAGAGLLGNSWEIINVFGKIVAYFIQQLFWIIQQLVDLLLAIPGSNFSGSIKIGWVLVFYTLLIVFIAVFRFAVRKYIFPKRLKYFSSPEFLNNVGEKSSLLPQINIKKYKHLIIKKFSQLAETEFNKKILALWLLVINCLLSVSVNYLYSSSRPARLVMLDVGQGDAIMLNWPRYHYQVLVDGGPGRKILPELGETMPFYDNRIELVILTHPHQDHLEGLITAQDKYKIRRILLPSLPQASSPDLYKIFWEKITDEKVAIGKISQGLEILQKNGEKTVADFKFFSPLFDYSQAEIKNLNNQSAVFMLKYPKRVLFMGDAQKELENIILARESYNINAEIIKIGHHGSRFSTSDKFLDAVNPQTALISVSKDNLYGHPARDTIKKLENRNIEIYKTDVGGRTEILLKN
ncbi:MAG: ComEC/Rec2 family competence protein [Candidatus Moraniibacteriota bacterium]